MSDSAASASERLASIDEMLGAGEPPSQAALDRLAELLGDESKAVQRRAAEAFVHLEEHGGEVVSLLERTMGGASRRGRWGAVFALSRLGRVPETALPILVDTLAAADGDLRWAACDILVRGSAAWRDRAAAALLELAVSGEERQRKMALYGLRDLDWRGAASERAARLALAATDRDLRLAGMASLARLARDRVMAARHIAALLGDADTRVRRAAAGTLGVLGSGDAAVLAALRKAMAASDESTARAAGRALQRLQP